MYLWVIIATFITSLFALGTSLRSDIKELYVEPQAQNVVTKLFVQHKSAMQYLTTRDRAGKHLETRYQPGEITTDMMNADLPFGFKPEEGIAKFTSWIYCLDKDNLEKKGAEALPDSCSGAVPPAGADPDAGVGNCCSGTGVTVYLVTYGCVPAKWRDLRSGKPSSSLLNSMMSTTGYVDGMGYVIPKKEFGKVSDDLIDTDMGIFVHGYKKYTPIPNYIINTSTGGRSFASVCGNLKGSGGSAATGVQDSCDYCLVYMTAF